MSKENIDALLDEDLVIRSNSLSGVVSNWNSAVASVGLNSVNILSDYAPLIDNGIAGDLFNNLNESLKSIDMICASISGSISHLIEEQNAIDNKGQTRASNRSSYSNVGGKQSNDDDVTPASYEETEDIKIDEEINKQFNDCIDELSEYEHIVLINLLLSISNNNLHELLYGENFDLIVKLQTELKNIDSLPKELKEILLKK